MTTGNMQVMWISEFGWVRSVANWKANFPPQVHSLWQSLSWLLLHGNCKPSVARFFIFKRSQKFRFSYIFFTFFWSFKNGFVKRTHDWGLLYVNSIQADTPFGFSCLFCLIRIFSHSLLFRICYDPHLSGSFSWPEKSDFLRHLEKFNLI